MRKLNKLLAVSCLSIQLIQPSIPVDAADSKRDRIIHLLNRISYGPTSGDIDEVERVGIEQYIDRQLEPGRLPLPPEVEKAGLKNTIASSPARLFLEYGPPAVQKLKIAGQQNSGGRFAIADQQGLETGRTRSVQGGFRNGNFGQPGNGFGPVARQGGQRQQGQRQQLEESGEPGGFNPQRRAQLNTPFNHNEGAPRTGDSESMRSEEARPLPDGSAVAPAPGRGPQDSRQQGQKNPLGEIQKKFYGDFARARLLRATQSPRQLEELMVDFWFNHFNVSFDKGLDHIWTGTYEEHAIRPHALGKFRDLLGATAHHAAMSFYLDNWQNTSPDSPGARGKLQGLNENYARELLELHTLGVDGGYSQTDVVELARILTGMGFQRRERYLRSAAMLDDQRGTGFDASRHDFKDKVLLKRTIHGSGEQEVEEALDLLARHPSTAKHIAFKLAQYFVADSPPASLVQKMSEKFSSTDGDIKSVLRTMLQSEEFWNPECFGSKYKTPYRYLISSLRATDCQISAVTPCIGFLNQCGMPLYRCLTPDGYKNTRSAWLSPDSLIKRINLATALGIGRWPGGQPSDYDYRSALPLLGTGVSKKTVDAIQAAPQPLRLSLVLGSPEFMMY